MGVFDKKPAAPVSNNAVVNDGVDIAAPARKGKLDAIRTMFFWALTGTLIVVVVVMLFSFLFILVRGGTLPSVEIFTTIVKVIGNILISLLGGGE